MRKFKTICEVAVKGKRVLLRTDFNVPINDIGDITDDLRIREALPTIKFIIDNGGKVILLSHLGRPDGKAVDTLSLAPVAKRLSQLLEKDVAFSPESRGEVPEKMVSKMSNSDVLVLENVRFNKGETDLSESEDLVKDWAKLGDVFVNDAFGTAHRKHASTYELPKVVDVSVAGFLIEKEVLMLTNLLHQAQSPFYALLGGSKISSKIGVLEALLPKVDGLLVGGAMVYTFMKALGLPVGNSLLDEEHITTAKQLIKKMKSKGVEFHLPEDILVAKSISGGAETKVVKTEDGIEDGWIGVDIGPETCAEWKEVINEAKTLFWNGPVGIFEIEAFSKGTFEVAEMLANASAMSIIGGGDSAHAIYKTGLNKKITYISTGGGACLEFIEYGTLPALEILSGQ